MGLVIAGIDLLATFKCRIFEEAIVESDSKRSVDNVCGCYCNCFINVSSIKHFSNADAQK